MAQLVIGSASLADYTIEPPAAVFRTTIYEWVIILNKLIGGLVHYFRIHLFSHQQ